MRNSPPGDSHFPEIMKKAMIQNAVADFGSFRNVKLTEQMDIAKGAGPIPYLQYIALLQSVVAIHDRNTPPVIKVKRITNKHDTNLIDDEYHIIDPDQEIHLDGNDDFFGLYQVYALDSQQKFRPSLN